MNRKTCLHIGCSLFPSFSLHTSYHQLLPHRDAFFKGLVTLLQMYFYLCLYSYTFSSFPFIFLHLFHRFHQITSKMILNSSSFQDFPLTTSHSGILTWPGNNSAFAFHNLHQIPKILSLKRSIAGPPRTYLRV